MNAQETPWRLKSIARYKASLHSRGVSSASSKRRALHKRCYGPSRPIRAALRFSAHAATCTWTAVRRAVARVARHGPSGSPHSQTPLGFQPEPSRRPVPKTQAPLRVFVVAGGHAAPWFEPAELRSTALRARYRSGSWGWGWVRPRRAGMTAMRFRGAHQARKPSRS